MYHFESNTDINIENKWLTKFKNTIYVLSLKEWFLDELLYKMFFKPIKDLGRKLDFLNYQNMLFYLLPLYAFAFFTYEFSKGFNPIVLNIFSHLAALISVLLVMKAFSERKQPRLALALVLFSHYWIALSVSFNEIYDFEENLIYLSGVTISGLLGLISLYVLKSKESKQYALHKNFGHIKRYPVLAFLFLISILGLMGFPITSSFVGVDLMLSHIETNQFILIFFNAISFIISGIALLRIYVRLFLGADIKRTNSSPLPIS
jgi:formate hydrogenlyase subunit 3/multisubunit Na+/H+ antiporter MnhD subunit